jgi:hypothetical protein
MNHLKLIQPQVVEAPTEFFLGLDTQKYGLHEQKNTLTESASCYVQDDYYMQLGRAILDPCSCSHVIRRLCERCQ